MPPANPPALQFVGVAYAWRRDAPVVVEIDRLEIAAGERVLLRGASGSGKSTLLALAAGVAVPQRGRVLLAGRPFSALSGAARDRLRADRIGVVFQQFNLLPGLSAVENALLACRFSTRRRARASQAAGDPRRAARALLHRLGLDDATIARPASRLSIGQQQRAALARALIGAPDLVLADEPTSALDAEHRDRFLALLAEACAASGAALLMASHDPALAFAFDRVVALGPGGAASADAGAAGGEGGLGAGPAAVTSVPSTAVAASRAA